MHTPEANTRRLSRALEDLHSLCVTLKARQSFLRFQQRFAETQGLPELARSIAGNALGDMGENAIRTAGEYEDDEVLGQGKDLTAEDRKASFIDRLLGRKRRSLGLTVTT